MSDKGTSIKLNDTIISVKLIQREYRINPCTVFWTNHFHGKSDYSGQSVLTLQLFPFDLQCLSPLRMGTNSGLGGSS